jgi:hypothetical protein
MDTCFLARIALRDCHDLPKLMSQVEALERNERFSVESGFRLQINRRKVRLNEAAGPAAAAWVAEQQAAGAEVRLGHEDGDSCDQFTQEDADVTVTDRKWHFAMRNCGQ